jgi:hypothetical protein
MVWVWLAFMVAGWVKPAWRRVQKSRAAGWPVGEGRIESVDVSQPKQLGIFTSPKSRSSRQVAEIGYSYSVAGNFHAGRYKRDFATEEEAWDFLRDLKGKPVSVRYSPDKPSTSALLDAEVDTLLQARPPALAPSFRPDTVPDWLRPLLWPFVALSALGLVVSLWVHIAAVMGRNFPAGFWVLHVGIFVAWIPAVLVAQKRVGNVNRKDFWKVVLKGAPDWMRYMVYGFFGYAMVNFALFMLITQSGGHSGNDSPAQWRGFSGHWMAFYSAALAILYAAATSSSRWRCTSGHRVPENSKFCQRCGQPVVQTGSER